MGRPKKAGTTTDAEIVEQPMQAQEATDAQTETGALEATEFEQGTTTLMTAEDLANDALFLEQVETLVAEAKAIIKERNKPAPLTDEQKAIMNHEALVKKHGKDYVKAKNGNRQTVFSRTAWVGMGKNKNGWVEMQPDLPELK